MYQKFEVALRENSIKKMMNIPKSDLHNHAGRGGINCNLMTVYELNTIRETGLNN